MKKIFFLITSFAVVSLLGAGCAAPSAPVVDNNQPVRANVPAQTAAKADVLIQNFSFSPLSLTINKGMAVVWTNNDSVGHTIISDDGNVFSSGVINSGGSYSFVFNTPGTYTYHCSIHPSMKGTVIVNQ